MLAVDFKMAHLYVVRPGLLTTVQDRGRWGFQSRGVPVAGPMDPRAHRLANALAGNDAGAATLEITLIGPEITFEDDRLVAVAGADFLLTLNDRALSVNRGFAVAAGSRLRFGARARGSRAYLAVAGGIVVAPALGSRATHLVSRMGGLNGRALMAGDRVPLGAVKSVTALKGEPRSASELLRMPHEGHATVRVLAGPDHDRFLDRAFEALQSAPYTIATDSDRMGYRLHGPQLRHRSDANIISDATPLGALQVPASEQPLLLMADRQTTGGYPKLATVISADIGIAGQLGPGDRISFKVCSRKDAIAALIAEERGMMAVERATGV
jgi:antagonist of KipI